ncbi:MAG: diheme cytochrome c [Pseudomonadota bacterium]
MKALTILLAILGLSGTAQADRMPSANTYLPAYKSECGSCHVAYPPSLLSAQDWRTVMSSLDKHYGDNASLDEKTRQAIESFLADQSGSRRTVSGTRGNELPRITTSTWFVRKHHEVPRADWHHAKVKTPANCSACHTRAAEGSYREREIVMPNGGRWEDD